VSTYFPDDSFDEPVPSSAKRSVRKTEPLPTFNKAATIAICEERLKWGALLVGIQIARRTKRDGTFQLKLERIAKLVGCSSLKTVTNAINEIVEAGLMVRRYTNTGCVYEWTRAAYKGADVGASLEIGCSYEFVDLSFRGVVLATYLSVWRSTYTPNAKKPSTIIEGDKSDIHEERLKFLKPYADDLANRIRLSEESVESALARALLLFFGQWMSRKGLASYKHPLAMLSERDIKEDFATIYTQDAKTLDNREIAANITTKEITNSADANEFDAAYREQSRNALEIAKSFDGQTNAIPKRAA
jgi:hypothetical protein